MRLFLLSCAAALIWVSCQTEAASSPSQPQSAQKLYVVKCAKCHELYDPKKYSDADWEMWMNKMRKKSKLKLEQFESIQNFTAKIRVPETGPIETLPK